MIRNPVGREFKYTLNFFGLAVWIIQDGKILFLSDPMLIFLSGNRPLLAGGWVVISLSQNWWMTGVEVVRFENPRKI